MSGENARFREFRHGAGFLLSRLGTLAERSWGAALHRVGLTQTEFVVLVALTDAGAMRQRELAAAAGMDPRNLVPVVAVLTRRRLIAVRPDPDDGRAKLLALSDAGAELLRELEVELRPERDAFFGALAPGEYARLCELLEAVHSELLAGRGDEAR
jgi:DNA-binding MarR family transcriptional regulator